MNKRLYRSLGSMVACFSVPSAWSAGTAFAPVGSWMSIGTGIAGVGVVGAGVMLLPRATKCLERHQWFRGGLLLQGGPWHSRPFCTAASEASRYNAVTVSRPSPTRSGDTSAQAQILIAAAFEITAMGLFFAADIERDEESKAPLDEQPPPAESR
jgi:hypothetical protein